jgi:hypothetical protein
MNDNGTAITRGAHYPKIPAWQVVFGVCLAGTSGAAILAHVFGPLPMMFTVPFIVMPSVFFVLLIIGVRSRLNWRFQAAARLLVVGAVAGFLGTICYDLSRPLVRLMFSFRFNPFGAMPIFGSLMTGLPVTSHIAIIVGWIYHFWNGISFGMMFALVRPRGGALPGFIWGLGLQALMFITYPRFLEVRLNDPGFVAMGLIGHSIWGIVLGIGVRRWGQHV